MPWIKQIDEKEASNKLQTVYGEVKAKRGKISNIMKVHSLDPVSMKNHLDLYLSIVENNSSINEEERELIAVVVSSLNNCSYCIHHHSKSLNKIWNDESKVNTLISDYKSVEFPIRIHAILNYAEKLTATPGLVNEYDVQNLRIHNLSDEDILNINLIVSYFNFVGRIANGLGVDFKTEDKD